MICLLSLAVRFRHRTHKLLIFWPNHFDRVQALIEHAPNERLRFFPVAILLASAVIGGFWRAVSHGPDHRLEGRFAFRGGRDAVTISGNYAEVELPLRFLWYGQTEYVLYTRRNSQMESRSGETGNTRERETDGYVIPEFQIPAP